MTGKHYPSPAPNDRSARPLPHKVPALLHCDREGERQDSDWIAELRDACKSGTQGAIARKVGYSPAVINQVLKGAYKGDLTSVQRAVEGALMGATVDCPVIGELPRQRCIEYQRTPFRATNPMRVQLSRTCPTCVNRRT